MLKVAYVGSGFSGFQRQSKAKTVQGTLEAALSQVLNHPVQLQGAGRTDIGVHARGQVVAFQSGESFSLDRLCHSVNSVLRDPVAVVEAASLDDDDPFHPRFSAIARTYSYYALTNCGHCEANFWNDRAWCLPDRFDHDLAQKAADLFLGDHDFSTFSYKAQEMETRVRQVSLVQVKAEGATSLLSLGGQQNLVRLTITANGFLRRMVRLIAAGVFEVATGHRSLEDLQARLDACDPTQAPHPAPPRGLYLDRVDYQPDPFEAKRRHAVARLNPSHRVKRPT